jgi:MATE family multidrug resistance protein
MMIRQLPAGAVAAAVLGLGAALGIFFGRETIAALFTADEDLRAMGASLLRVVAVLVLLDAGNNAIGGVLSGLGMQRAIALSQLPSYYLVGIPMGASLAFLSYGGRDDGVLGLWIGMAAAMASTVAIQAVALSRHSWEASGQQAKQRMAVELLPIPRARAAEARVGGSLDRCEGGVARAPLTPASDEIGDGLEDESSLYECRPLLVRTVDLKRSQVD